MHPQLYMFAPSTLKTAQISKRTSLFVEKIMRVLKLNLFIYLLLTLLVKCSLSDEFHEKANETDFVLKHYCSSQLPDQCLTVFNGNFSFTRAQDICQSFDGVQINLKNQSTLDFLLSILAETDDIHNLVSNAKRAIFTRSTVDLKGWFQLREGSGNALVLKSSIFSWYSSLERWDSKYKALCEYKNCSGRDSCYLVSSLSYNWFEARRFCLRNEADLMTDVETAKALKFPKPISEYWLGASRFFWTWVDVTEGISRLSQTPEWSEPYYEDQSTECASVRISKCGNDSCLKWQAHQCDTPTDLSVVCKFNDSYFLYANKMKGEMISKGTLLMIVVAVVLVLMTCIPILSYVAIKSRLKKQTNKQNNSSGRYSMVRLEGQNNDQALVNLNYPVLDLPERDEITYETIDGASEAVYMNSSVEHTYTNISKESPARSLYCLGKGFYSIQTTNNDRPETSNPRSPAIVVDNEIYEGKKSKSLKNLVKLKLFRRSGKTSADSDTSGSLSTYEPLSPTSFGRRMDTSESTSPTCEGAGSPDEHFQETNDYTALSNDPKD